MNAEQQRIAIAAACGWQDVGFYSGEAIGLPPGFTEDQCPEGADQLLPDYLNDLNAMHEAEKTLSGPTNDEESQRSKYAENLVMVLAGQQEVVDIWFFDHIHATAAQRAEAFLRALGLWRDS